MTFVGTVNRTALGVPAVMVVITAFAGCARQYNERGEPRSGMLVFHPIAQMEAQRRAERFLRAYLGNEPRHYEGARVTRWINAQGKASWTFSYFDGGIDTGPVVEVQENTGRGRVKTHWGNVLLIDNYMASSSATDEFRELDDFKYRLAAQEAQRSRKR
jgi:hypothetical protein